MARARKRRQWGKGEVYPSTSGTWGIRWREGGRRRRRAGFATREDAERVLAKVLGEIAQERAGMPPDSRSFPTLAELAEDWLDRRDKTHRAATDDRCRWNKHLRPAFGHLRASEVDSAALRRFVEAKLAGGMNPATVGHCVRLLSTFYSDLCERPRETGATSNPVRTLPRSTRRLMRPTHDPQDTPFLESLDEVRRVYLALRDGDPDEDVPGHEQTAVAFVVGAFAGLRTGEVLALRWDRVDLDARRIRVVEQVHRSRLGPLKDDEARTVPIQDALAPVLAAWKIKTGGEGLLFTPDQPGRRSGRGTGAPATFVRPHTLHARLREALTLCKLSADLTWYQCTRHTFASQWVMANGSIEKLAAVLGHSSTEVTRRYAHLRPEHFKDADRRLLDADLFHGGDVVPIARDAAGGGALGPRMAHAGDRDVAQIGGSA
ncbi:MAG TPA: site-specific integrase [Anaeromyxobacter sp.]